MQVQTSAKCLTILENRAAPLGVLKKSIEEAPDELFNDKPWGKGNNPMTAVHEFLQNNSRFEADDDIEARLQITVAPGGYLKCVAD